MPLRAVKGVSSWRYYWSLSGLVALMIGLTGELLPRRTVKKFSFRRGLSYRSLGEQAISIIHIYQHFSSTVQSFQPSTNTRCQFYGKCLSTRTQSVVDLQRDVLRQILQSNIGHEPLSISLVCNRALGILLGLSPHLVVTDVE